MSESYEQGLQDGIELYGRVCSTQSNCEDCPIGMIRGSEITCQEFMSKFPSKMVSLLSEMDSEEYTYYKEYITRFPNCNLDLDTLSEIACRKFLFEGFTTCEEGDCKACWLEKYIGDVTVEDDVDSEEEESVEE